MKPRLTESRGFGTNVSLLAEFYPALLARADTMSIQKGGVNSTRQLMFTHFVRSISCGLIESEVEDG